MRVQEMCYAPCLTPQHLLSMYCCLNYYYDHHHLLHFSAVCLRVLYVHLKPFQFFIFLTIEQTFVCLCLVFCFLLKYN